VPGPPLSTPLSQLLVAFTIELDNEFERVLGEVVPGRFRVSVVMWSNFLRFVGDGTAVGELPEAAGLPKARVLSTLGGMERWRYVTVRDGRRDGYGSARGLKPDWVVRPTPTGRAAQELWPPLFGEIEARWRTRFGKTAVEELRRELRAVVEGVERDLPEYLPVVTGSNGMVAEIAERERRRPPPDSMCALLAQALLAYTLEFERESPLSLPLSENVVRVLDDETDVRELPAAAGVSKEAVAMSLTSLKRRGFVSVEGQQVRLTPAARRARKSAARAHREIDALRVAMQPFLDGPKLAEGLRVPEGGWRAEPAYLAQTERVLADPLEHLPRYPMVLHRGGWPDGS
jgi:hypothetical protein